MCTNVRFNLNYNGLLEKSRICGKNAWVNKVSTMLSHHRSLPSPTKGIISSSGTFVRNHKRKIKKTISFLSASIILTYQMKTATVRANRSSRKMHLPFYNNCVFESIHSLNRYFSVNNINYTMISVVHRQSDVLNASDTRYSTSKTVIKKQCNIYLGKVFLGGFSFNFKCFIFINKICFSKITRKFKFGRMPIGNFIQLFNSSFS